MRVLELISGNIKNGIFNALKQNAVLFPWLSETVADSLDFDFYYSTAGVFEVSPFVISLMDNYPDFLQILANVIATRYANKWRRLVEAFELNYNPIENYNMTENRNKDTTANGTTKTAQNLTTSLKTSAAVFGFNSGAPSDSEEETRTQNVQGDADTNKTETVKEDTEAEQLTRSGNIGVTTTQRMLEQELELRKTDIFAIILADTASVIALKYYGRN